MAESVKNEAVEAAAEGCYATSVRVPMGVHERLVRVSAQSRVPRAALLVMGGEMLLAYVEANGVLPIMGGTENGGAE